MCVCVCVCVSVWSTDDLTHMSHAHEPMICDNPWGWVGGKGGRLSLPFCGLDGLALGPLGLMDDWEVSAPIITQPHVEGRAFFRSTSVRGQLCTRRAVVFGSSPQSVVILAVGNLRAHRGRVRLCKLAVRRRLLRRILRDCPVIPGVRLGAGPRLG